MIFAKTLTKRAFSAAVVVAGCTGLAGCFDLEQKVALHHDESGTYTVVVATDGFLGKEMDKHPSKMHIGDDHAVSHVSHRDGKTIDTSEIAFRNLSDLKLDDETISLHVAGKKLFGLGATEMNFHRAFHVDQSRHDHNDGNDDHLGNDILHSMFGDHTYTFSVWLPGTIEHIAPLRVGGQVIHPVVWADAYGHTIIWKMKLSDVLMAKQVDFDVDFAAYGDFHDAQSSPEPQHRHDNT